jgi:hypothetical protein
VAQQQHLGPGVAGGLSQQGMTRAAGGGRQARGGLVAGPGQGAGLSAERDGLGDRVAGPGGALGLELVVNGQAEHGPAARPRPVKSQKQQGQGVAAAGETDGDGRGAIRIKPPIEGGLDLV